MKRILIVLAVILLMFSTNSFAQRATVLSAIDTNLPSSSKLTAAQLRTALKAISNSVYDELDIRIKTTDLQDPTTLINSIVDPKLALKDNIVTGDQFLAPIGFSALGISNAYSDQYGADVIAVSKFYLPFTITVNFLKVWVTTAAASSSVYMGIYSESGNKLCATSAVSSETTGLKSGATTATTLSPGFYWSAYVTTNNAVIVQGWPNNHTLLDNTITGGASNVVVGGVMPATLGTISGKLTMNGQLIQLKN